MAVNVQLIDSKTLRNQFKGTGFHYGGVGFVEVFSDGGGKGRDGGFFVIFREL